MLYIGALPGTAFAPIFLTFSIEPVAVSLDRIYLLSNEKWGEAMFSGAHVVIYSENAEIDRAFFRDVLELPNVDAGDGWLIFRLPPSEVAFHPAGSGGRHELYLMCENIEELRSALARKGVNMSEINDEGWGLLMHFDLPSGKTLGVYQARHSKPPASG